MRHQLRLGRSLPLAFLAVLAAVGAILLSGTAGNAATQAAPTNLDPPRITGTAQAGSTLTATEGRWSGNPTDINLQWRRCDENGGSCSNISGAEGQTYVLKTVDVGNTIRVRATAKNADGTGASTSVPTAVVKAATAPPPPTGGNGCQGAGATVQVGGITPPDRLSIDRASSTPAVVGGSSEQVTLRVRVSACNGKPVQGALVYATAVPYNQFTVPPEATTGADGVAELSMNRLRGYPATPRQQLLVFFIRARKQGESLLAGISNRRLVSVPVDLRR